MQPMLDTSHLPRVPEWKKAGDFEDILYEKSEEGIAKITINRPQVRNAFRPLTVREMETAWQTLVTTKTSVSSFLPAKEKMPSAPEETRRFAATAAMSAATAFRV